MRNGWRYRIAAVAGVCMVTATVVLIANLSLVQAVFTTYTPLFWRLDPHVLTGPDLVLALVLNTVIVVAALLPLYKPQPRRKLDIVFFTQKRVLAATFAIATLGYFNYSYRLPRTTVALVLGLLLVTLPWWFVWINQRPNGESVRTVVIGDDVDQMRELIDLAEGPMIGYVCPTELVRTPARQPAIADGGVELQRLGGLSRIREVLVDNEVDTAILAFRETDRGEFFGTLDACYEHGVSVKVHRRFADAVLTEPGSGDELVDVAIEPWDPQDYLFKRLFDVHFAWISLLLLAPVMVLIAIAIKLDDGGSILYGQERTAGFGEPFTVYKFRTMVEDAEASTGPRLSDEDQGGVDPRVTRVGRILRRSHLDEIPQLFAVLKGDMSMVGPRPERPEIETTFDPSIEWEKRWFVKPGLTGLAQINGVTGYEPDRKLHYDLEYIRRQSFWFDIRIVIRQFWKVIQDLRTEARPSP